MDLIDGRVVVTTKDLRKAGVESLNTIESAIKRKQITSFKRGLYLYDSLGEWRTLVQQNLCNGMEPKAWIQHKKKVSTALKRVDEAQLALENLPNLIEIDTCELDYFQKQAIDQELAPGYARLCGWLRFLLETKPSGCKKLGFEDKEAVYEAALVQLVNEHAHKLIAGQKVTNKMVLKRKVKGYKEAGAASVLSKKVGNTNAEKLIQVQKDLLIQLYSDFHKPDFEVVHRLFCEACEEHGWEKVCLSRVKQVLNQPAVKQIWTLPRHGTAVYRNKYDPTIKRMAPSFANAFWVMDGTPLELYFRDGKTAYNRFEIFPILDAYSWKVVGYSIGREEDGVMVKQALRMACQQEGVLPYQLQFDNSSAIKSKASQAIIDQLAKYGTPAQVGNARSKIIEPFFKHLNARVLKYFTNYSGSNITAKNENSHINKDALKLHFEEIPTQNQAIEQVHLAFATWNNQLGWKKGQSPAEMYAASKEDSKARQRLYSEAMDVAVFWYQPADTYEFTNRGFDITYKNERYAFDVEDVRFRSHSMGDKFQVRFDPERMDTLYLYQLNRPIMMDGKHVLAKVKTELPMAIVDRTTGSQLEYNRLAALKEAQRLQAEASYAEAVSHLPESLKEPITLERVHKKAMNKVRQTLKTLEMTGVKTMPLPVAKPFSLYGDEEEGGTLQKVI